MSGLSKRHESRHSLGRQALRLVHNRSVVAALSHRHIICRLAAIVAGVASALVVTPGPAATPGAIGVEIVPHRAIYRLSLLSARSSSPVVDVNGAMMFQWTDACDAWAVEQHFRMNFVYTEGDEVRMTTNYATLEAKSGATYRFNVRKTVNGDPDDDIRGEGELKDRGQGGQVRLDKPEVSEQDLPPGTLFPTRHTLNLLEQAVAGEHFVARTVFDGADTDGPTEISAVIGKKTMLKDGVNVALASKDRPNPNVLLADAKRDNRLLSGPAWPIRLAYFPVKSDSVSPEYEMSMLLLHNGIAEAMQIDYGDFTVNAVLETLEPLPKAGC